MGNVLSVFYNTIDDLHKSYYPKNNWLRPSLLGPTLMGAHVAWLMMSKEPAEKTISNNFIYLFSAGAGLGIQLWKSFVAPTSLRVLPRHMHSLNQSQLFPKYFFLTTLFSYGTLAAYIKMNPYSLWTNNESKYLGGILLAAFGLNAINWTFFGSKSVEYNMKVHEIEKLAGEGATTVGSLPKGNLLESNPEYMSLKDKFHLYHGLCTTVNLASLGCSVGQFYFLSRSFLAVIGLTYSVDAYYKTKPVH